LPSKIKIFAPHTLSAHIVYENDILVSALSDTQTIIYFFLFPFTRTALVDKKYSCVDTRDYDEEKSYEALKKSEMTHRLCFKKCEC